uniref:Uncharacterized protein n=1 Tax=Rhizophora mucronata TaxID=61149 RepID=A0A2P2KPK9_RHIMU
MGCLRRNKCKQTPANSQEKWDLCSANA